MKFLFEKKHTLFDVVGISSVIVLYTFGLWEYGVALSVSGLIISILAERYYEVNE